MSGSDDTTIKLWDAHTARYSTHSRATPTC